MSSAKRCHWVKADLNGIPWTAARPNLIKKRTSVVAPHQKYLTKMQRYKYLDSLWFVISCRVPPPPHTHFSKLPLLFCWRITEAPFSSDHPPDQIQWLSSRVTFFFASGNRIEGASPGNVSPLIALSPVFWLHFARQVFLFVLLLFVFGANRSNRSKVQKALYCKCAMQSPWWNVIAF